jgi:uracil-DNA glycosylase
MALHNQFEKGWWNKLAPFLTSKYFHKIATTLKTESETRNITPSFDDTFRAFRECPYDKLKVVILGMDPYPTAGNADGLAFSARYKPLDCPKSLKHMIDAIEREVYGGFAIGFNEEYMNPDLTRWANQGVLLLNAALSTVVGKSGEHLDLWAPFTSFVLNTLSRDNSGIIYILLGRDAKAYKTLINAKSNHILTASHPSSINFSGLKQWDSEGVFLKTNELLEASNGPEAKILW